jgi:hypothetical protein
MSCPLLRRSQGPACRAVSGGPVAVPREVVAAYCRATWGDCPAYRYLRAAGHLLNPADFRAWVVDGLPPGRTTADPPAGPDGPDGA